MSFTDLQQFVSYLDANGELARIAMEVDPELEITEIASRAVRQGMPALLFEHVTGSPYPLLINTLATSRRIELALGVHPDHLGQELIRFIERAMPPTPKLLFSETAMVTRMFHARPRTVRRALSQEIIEAPNLHRLPIVKSWPDDGGRFITLPQVFTYDPVSGKRNVGMYRMQLFDERTTGMHWQIQKGGGFQYFQAEKRNKPFELAVALGTDPALLLATIAALPEGIDEAMFAGFLRNKRTDFVTASSISVSVPANAEFILEGVVQPHERRVEGPFGDHFGHYSAASEFPVFHCTAVTHRKNPIYPATVVGIPPMEDKYLGDATQQILGPLAKLLHSEVQSLWAYYEAGFHNLLVVSIEERYQKEAMKTALGLMGTQQLSLTKCLITVPSDVDPRDFTQVMRAVNENFDPHFDFMMLPKVPLDTLDFTSFTMNLGSKMIIDATRKRRESRAHPDEGTLRRAIDALAASDRRIRDVNLIDKTLLLVKVNGGGAEVLSSIVRRTDLAGIALAAAVSEDVNLRDRENYIWGLFTRFDCERDVQFTETTLHGISPVYKGMMGIDATWKPGYQQPLVMDEHIVKKVDERWDHYWKK
jgi:4-hydroxybenzoate decarboxylase subunit C